MERKCETCKWHIFESVTKEKVCVNDRSDYCADWTDDDFKCSKWEEKDVHEVSQKKW